MTRDCFVIPAHFVPEVKIFRCFECPYFYEHGGTWNEHSVCRHPNSDGEDLYWEAGNDIATGCPMMVKENLC